MTLVSGKSKVNPGYVNILFKEHVILVEALKILFDHGLRSNALKACRREPVSATVKVEVGKEKEWIEKLSATEGVDRADYSYLSDGDEQEVDELKKRLKVELQ